MPPKIAPRSDAADRARALPEASRAAPRARGLAKCEPSPRARAPAPRCRARRSSPAAVRTVTARRASADSEIDDLALDGAAVEAREQHVLDRAPRAGVVLIARQKHEARVVAAERLAPAEDLELVPLLEREDAEADRAQLVERRLEQIVARQRVEDVLQRLAAMAARVEAGLAHDLRDLHPQQRDRARALVVGARSEQAEKRPLDATACRSRRTP